MKPGDLVRIRRPEYGEEYWEQVGVIIEVDDHPGVPNPLRIMASVGVAWLSSGEVEIVNDGTDGYDSFKENQ